MDQTPIVIEPPSQQASRRWFDVFLPRGLSGKLLIITTIFIMLVEIFVFVPSVANFRLTWLARHFNTGEAAAVALEQLDSSKDNDRLISSLLDVTQTEMIGMRDKGVSYILATRDMPASVDLQVRLAEPGRMEAVSSIHEALYTLLFGGDRVLRVFGPMKSREDATLELVFLEAPLRSAMMTYARNTMLISLGISLATALLVFLTLRWFFIRPLQRISERMLGFARDPENASQIIEPSGRRDEIGVAEEQLSAMQRQVRGTMTQQRHLAELGLAVSKINHDLRNILASASLFSDRLSGLDDPTVKHLAPRLVRTIDRAVDYTRSVLAYGRAGEDVPQRNVLRLHQLMEDVAQVLALDLDDDVEWVNEVVPDFEVQADADQLFRVILNLCRNSVQVMTAQNEPSVVNRIHASATQRLDKVAIRLSDTGPGFSDANGRDIFSAFNKSTRNGGTGLGLAIAADLVRGHGGTIELLQTDEPGAHFEITLPMTGPMSSSKQIHGK